MGNVVYIFGSGTLTKDPRSLMKEPGVIVAADGGYKHLEKFNIKPNIFIGDFDSQEKQDIKCDEVIELSARKDDTDTGYAVKLMSERGYKNFVFFGTLGGSRIDHSIAMIQILADLISKGKTATVYLPNLEGYMTALQGPSYTYIYSEEGNGISLFSFTKEVKGLTTKGSEYDLNDYTLSSFYPLGVSNAHKNKRVDIEIKEGILLIVEYFSEYKNL